MAHAPDGQFVLPVYSSRSVEIIRNILVALSVSFVALSLGAAFGVLSGRGAVGGMLSAGLIAFIAAALGGTRVQCSGPVAPTAAIMAGVLSVATARIAENPAALGGMTADHFLNFICLLTGGFMILMAIFRTGKLITYVPDSVISGFMTGVGLIIWIGQVKTLLGIHHQPLGGPLMWNAIVAFSTLALTFLATPIMNLIHKSIARFIPATLFALVVMVIITVALNTPIERLGIDITLHSAVDVWALISMNIPRHITWPAFEQAWFYGFEFALISFLDSLMVALVVDRLRGETTRKNKELVAQGVANAAVAFVGGIPGTQASIRSVMMTQEGASMRMAGMLVGVFVIIEMALFQDHLEMIPKAVFMGILLKVGWNVIDRQPIIEYLRSRFKKTTAQTTTKTTGLEFFILIGTAIITVYNLCLAVIAFTALYYLIIWRQKKICALPHAPVTEQLRNAVDAD